MELRQLQCMVACAQTKSFSKAAATLFTSQSNVSKTIASLEKELGKKLFDRKQHGIELTEKGKQIYKYALSMVECSSKIIDCAEEDEAEELRVSFQPSSWFANAFCSYYIQEESSGERYHMISAPVDEILRRVIADQDQLGFAYIENSQLNKLKEMFPMNHIGYYVLKQTRTVLYCGARTDYAAMTEIPLIQGDEDHYSGMSLWKEHNEEAETSKKLKVRITTNSDYIMQNILQKTNLSNISPNYLSHEENSLKRNIVELNGTEQTVHFVCLFRNDKKMDGLPKKFLSYIRRYIAEEQ